jgi:hypothetical protein
VQEQCHQILQNSLTTCPYPYSILLDLLPQSNEPEVVAKAIEVSCFLLSLE